MTVRILSVILLATGLAAQGSPPLSGTWSLRESRVSYTVNHPFKKATGITTQTRGKARCTAAAGRKCEVLLAVGVASFDSGDSNRDLHMLEATKGAAFPVITVRAVFDPTQVPAKADLVIEFAGQKASVPGVKLSIVTRGTAELVAEGKFTLKLSDFAIVRPSLLGLSIDNEVPVTFSSVWIPAK